ncbi:MAG: integrase arm-type DNA-binding domain-containing protein [Solimonas sp.]
MLKAIDLRNKLAPGKHSIGDGAYLEVKPSGAAKWRLKYRLAGVERRITLGAYPAISTISAARDLALKARIQIREGLDPVAERRAKVAALVAKQRTFAEEADAWLAARKPTWAAETLRKATLAVNDLKQDLADEPIAALRSAAVAASLRRIEKRAPDLARKAKQAVQSIVKQAIADGHREEGQFLSLKRALGRQEVEHMPAATTPEELGEVLRKIRAYPGRVVRAALLMLAYTAQRPAQISAMRWDEVSGDEWRFAAGRTKTRAHIVSLPGQALALLDEMRQYTGGKGYVFPALARQRSPHLHRDTMSLTLREGLGLRGKQVPHGFRTSLRTLGRERLQIAPAILEAQVAHDKKGQVQKAYDRTEFTKERRQVMQQWADWVDSLAEAAEQAAARAPT